MRLKAKTFTLLEVFTAYRACKTLLARDTVPHPLQPMPKPGYERAMDPNLIRASRVHPPGPSAAGFSATSMMSGEEAQWTDLVDWVDRAVSRLTTFQRDMIRVQFLGETVMSNEEVIAILHAAGWTRRQRWFEAQKRAALIKLSKFLRVVLDTID